MELTPEQIRILGCLIEKQHATPEIYPLTLNALVTASNQSTNRDPVVKYDQDVINPALESLRMNHGLVRMELASQGSRASKYKHVFDTQLGLTKGEICIMAVLMLRGPQTPGELATRVERLHTFDSLNEVVSTLEALSDPTFAPPEVAQRATLADEMLATSVLRNRPPSFETPQGYLRTWPRPLVIKLDRAPGQKENRYCQQLGGLVDPSAPVVVSAQMSRSSARADDLVELRAENERLAASIQQLRDEFEEFKRQF